MKNIIILGAGENGCHMAEVISAMNQIEPIYKIIGFLDDDASKIGTRVMDLPVLNKMEAWPEYRNAYFSTPLVSSPKKNINKKKAVDRLGIPDDRYETIIHPSLRISDSVRLGAGNFLLSGVEMQSRVRIGSHVYVSNNSVICTNAEIGDYCNVSNSASVMGGVRIKEGAYVGANASIIGYAEIGAWAVVGMGAVVIDDVGDYQIVAGNPVRVIGENTPAKVYNEFRGTLPF